jgi:hypothetical protein
MSKSPTGVVLAILASLGIWTCSSLLFAQTQDDLFNGDIFHEVRLYMAPQDLDTDQLAP